MERTRVKLTEKAKSSEVQLFGIQKYVFKVKGKPKCKGPLQYFVFPCRLRHWSKAPVTKKLPVRRPAADTCEISYHYEYIKYYSYLSWASHAGFLVVLIT